MADGKPSLRIDWFDGSVIEEAKPSRSAAIFDETELPGSEVAQKPVQPEKKPIGFKRLLDISLMEPDKLTLEISYRPGFWNLLDQSELKGDFIVLIVKILDSIFKTIRFDEANSKMTRLLENRFLPSDFLEKLSDYLSTLPDVKIVEKRMNSQLWDDIEAFFYRAVSLCEGVLHFQGKKSIELSRRLDKVLKVLRMSAIGVAQEQSERISEELFERISKLEDEMEVEEISLPAITTENLQTFKSLNIFPTQEDLFPPDTVDQSEEDRMNIVRNIKITPSIDRGAYMSVEHYLDIQFRLLREDYIGPLREGICKYLENPFKTRHENIRVHKEVRVCGTIIKNNKVGHLIDLAWKECSIHNRVKQKLYNKQLMFGSLLLFTNDGFRTILCATVLDSDVNVLRDGYVVVSFRNPVSKDILSNTYLMVESEVFFEPYHQVLKVLQRSQLNKLPMQKYIVDVKPEIQPPAHLTPETIYTIKARDKSEIPFTVLDTDKWPTEHLDLDISQLEAFKFALTREFAVIQGPPGTGKTFIGIKIASIILQNISLKDTPMLVICYTNNALDQFLEGILNITDKVIRLGGQSKSSKLEPYNLKSVRAKMNCKHHGFSKSKRELEMIYKEITELQSEIDICETGILCYRNVKPFLKIGETQYELQHNKEDSVFHWLFEHLEVSSKRSQEEEIEEDSWENFEEIDSEDGKIEECFSEKMALKQIENISNTIRQLIDLNVDVEKNPERISIFEKEAEKIRKRLDCFKNQMESQKIHNREYKMEKVDDLYNLSTVQRWQMYFNAARKVREELLTRMDVLLEKHAAVSLELEDLSTQVDSEVVRTARVVGATTTAAATRHALLNKMNSPILIVEEAAEVLEAHIVASLTFSVQHLILIGDHKQLRPTAANYRLAKECNLEVSLFERMIRNGIHARTLTTQRRMRPDFVQLLVPEIYTKLDSHASVINYRHVRGMSKNLFFLSHDVLEDSECVEDSWSHENTFEAEWCVALARYLLTNGYTCMDVTVLTTYSGQVSRIRKVEKLGGYRLTGVDLNSTPTPNFTSMPALSFIDVKSGVDVEFKSMPLSQKFEALKDVKITAVDNFQGEESRIVILSLVRSNKDGKIGFLAAANRICVALSRAKEGFFIFGNMGMLSKASTMWMSINKKLSARGAIGNQLCTDTPTRTAAELNELCLRRK